MQQASKLASQQTSKPASQESSHRPAEHLVTHPSSCSMARQKNFKEDQDQAQQVWASKRTTVKQQLLAAKASAIHTKQ
jgi:hypothetical protein